MQNKTNKSKQPVELVYKPIIRGSWHGKDAWKLAFKRMLAMLGLALVYVIGGLMLVFDSLWGRIGACCLIVFVCAYYLYASGMTRGQSDAAFGEIIYARQQEGHNVPEGERERSFHPLKGLFATLVGAVPFVLVALVFAFITERSTYQLGALPSWTAGLMTQSEFGDALAYYNQQSAVAVVDVLRIIVRAMIMPFINVAAAYGSEAELLAERLSPLLILIAPMGYGIGYTQGLKARARINTGIKMGDAKKKRKERKARKQRQQSKTPERLI